MTIILQQEKQATIAEIKRDVAALREAVDKLHKIEELTVPADLEDITDHSWVRQQVNPRITLIKGDASLTADEQRQRQALWLAIKQRALRTVEKVLQILERWPGLSWLPDEDGKNFHLEQTQIEQVATQRATREVPPQAEEHWELICKMREAVEALRNFEAEHQVKDAPLFYLARMTENQLYQAWISRDILLSSRTIGGKVIAPQKITNDYF